MGAYQDDLAYIHDAGFGHLAEHAAPELLDLLRRQELTSGLIVDLGCGSGIASAQFAAAGYDVLGIDLSPSMIALAQKRVPAARFRVGSILSAELPVCVGVAAIGEIVNFLFDAANSKQALARLFRRVYAALAPGGVLLLDAAGPGRVPGAGPVKNHFLGDDWAVTVTAQEDRRRTILTRRITSFRRLGPHYRRSDEVHRLRLYHDSDVLAFLRAAGFRVRRRRRYGALSLPPGLTAFEARK